MNGVKVSIIVPVYNSERSIKRCIKSLLNQTYPNIEIIVVNDGSTDNSLKICNALSFKDKRLLVYTQSNSGVSSARNKGISLASGDYIGFVDADDWVDKNMYSYLLNKAIEYNSDITGSRYTRDYLFVNKRISKASNDLLLNDSESIKSWLSSLLFDGNNDDSLCIVTKIYKKSLIVDNALSFPLDWSRAEDNYFSINSLLVSKRVFISNKSTYHYVKSFRIQSLTSKKRNTNYKLFVDDIRYWHYMNETVKPSLNINVDPIHNDVVLFKKAVKHSISLLNNKNAEQQIMIIFGETQLVESAKRLNVQSSNELTDLEKKGIYALANKRFIDWKSFLYEKNMLNDK